MKERLLFVAAGMAQTSAIQEARKLDYYIIAMDGAVNAPGFVEAHEVFIADITNPEEVVRVFCSSRADAIVSISCDAALIAVAIACEKLGLPGISVDNARVSRSKLLQRELISSAGLLVPQYRAVSTLDAALKSWDDFQVEACVFKPIDGSGSRGVSLVDQRVNVSVAFQNAQQNSSSGLVMIESFIGGIEYSVEAWVVNSNPHILATSEKLRSEPPYLLDKEVHFPDNLPPQKRRVMVDYAIRAIRACGFRDGPVHMELIYSDNGPVIVELAARGAGFKVFTIILPHITGISMVQASIELALGATPDLKELNEPTAASLVFISPKLGILKSINGLEKISTLAGVQEVMLYAKVGEHMNNLQSGSDRVGHILVFNKDPVKCRSTAQKALKLLELEV
jgi:biotin carboxylase